MEKRVCKKCIMPECHGHVEIGDDGICSLCKRNIEIEDEANALGTSVSKDKLLESLHRKIDKKRGKGKYDCAVAVSGGKDSIMSLYIVKNYLKLNPLAIFVDNGFSIPEMYDNIRNASRILGVDLIEYKAEDIINLFKVMLQMDKQIYFCRVCHLILDKHIKDLCIENDISMVFGGYTKGQSYLAQDELFWIYKISDKNTIEFMEGKPEYEDLLELFKSPMMYAAKHYRHIEEISPFKYYDYDEKNIIELLQKELSFKLPSHSWPKNSTNCLFNYMSQYMGRKQFGYTQHETELSGLIRSGEMTRERALELINTPITKKDLYDVLDKLELDHEIIDSMED
ncbi:MAG: phosphoadenosine phosphosulfate reductase family protein [Pseudobutyrivibrio sp.]|nr:phosphoadenosine phosphosulfate reductase family protein [Pseudobutyrivibrio sp.]